MTYEERKAQVKGYLGKTVTVEIDRPIGYVHHKSTRTLTYPINYGYIPGVIGGDGEELDVYVLGVTEPLRTFTGRIIGIIHRADDVEDKLVSAPIGCVFNQAEIAEAVHFQEQYYHTTVESLRQKSCGAVVFRRTAGTIEYLILFQKRSQTWSFPKGHMEVGETELQTASREIGEEIGLSPALIPGFRTTVEYPLTALISKEVVLFLAEAKQDPVTAADEIEACRWVSADTAKKLLYPQYESVIDQTEKRLHQPV